MCVSLHSNVAYATTEYKHCHMWWNYGSHE